MKYNCELLNFYDSTSYYLLKSYYLCIIRNKLSAQKYAILVIKAYVGDCNIYNGLRLSVCL